MSITREELVKIARTAVGGINRPANQLEKFNPMTFDPPEWVLDAMRAAYDRGFSAGQLSIVRDDDDDFPLDPVDSDAPRSPS